MNLESPKPCGEPDPDADVISERDSAAGRGNLPHRVADFDSFPDAIDYAARSDGQLYFHNARGHCEHSISYAEARGKALDLARRLRGLGLERGEHVGIVADMHPDFICMFYACQYGGFVAVPLPVVSGLGGRRGYEQQLTRILENSAIQVIASPDSLMETFHRLADTIPSDRILTVSELEKCPPSSEALVPLGADELSHIQFSSGSTRFPLGVEISQRALMANARSIAADALQVRSSDRIASWLPFYHDMGLVGQCIVPAVCQLTVDYLYPADFARRPLQWLKLISERGSTMSFSPDFGYEICTRLGDKQKATDLDLSRWRVAGIGGDMVKPHVLSRFVETFGPCGFQGSAFVASYGLAEATLAFSFEALNTGVRTDRIDKTALTADGSALPVAPTSTDETSARTFASCGKPLPGYRVEIRDDAGGVLPDRRVGEVLISGPSLMDGYYGKPEVTEKCIGSDGWLKTGDMGYLVGEHLYITGRRKDMIIVKGRNIWPQDLEWYVEREVGELQAGHTAAFGFETPEGEETVVILVQCRRNDPEKRERLQKEVASAVNRNAGIICRVELIPPRSLPFTTSGKLIRSKAKKRWLDGDFEENGLSGAVQVRVA